MTRWAVDRLGAEGRGASPRRRWRVLVGLAALLVAGSGLAACVADPPPIIGTATAGDGRVLLSWEPPLAAPRPITAYEVQASKDGAAQAPVVFDASSTTRIVGGLTNGVSYTFAVRAVNALGHTSAWSSASNEVVPGQQIATAGRTCALVDGGGAKCWGGGVLTPTAVPGLTDATSISVGTSACALITDGTVECWGSNVRGELGDGTTTDSATPVTVLGITDATAIAVRQHAACALLSSGSIKCWGHYFSWAGGDPWDWSSTPFTIAGISDATAIASAGVNACAVVTGGAVKCWGNNVASESTSPTFALIPEQVPGLSGATLVTAASSHFCARLPAGLMKCWGDGRWGELGHGIGGEEDPPNTTDWFPVSVTGMTGARVITAGDAAATCAIVDGGAAKCWGRNDVGQVGNGTFGFDYPNTPASVVGVSNAIALQTDGMHTCAVVPDDVLCWGSNSTGQLGTGSTGGFSATPVEVVGV